MSATYLMSYPGPSWQIRGAQNFRSEARTATNPRKALKEWIALADAITLAGGHILVMPPPTVEPPLTGIIYTANAGQLFRTGDQSLYLISQMSVPHRQGERDFVRAFATDAGLPTRNATHAWEGQADLQLVTGNRYIATWGVRSVRQSIEEVRPLLPSNARLLDLEIQQPFFHGDTCLDPLQNHGGDTVLLAHGGALVSSSLEAIRHFVGPSVEVYPIDRDDALAYACNSLAVHGTLIVPVGLSAGLRGQMVRRGFTLVELELGELFGKGGGGPRCLVNELRGLVLNPGAPDYGSRRDELCELAERYPEQAAVAPPPRTDP